MKKKTIYCNECHDTINLEIEKTLLEGNLKGENILYEGNLILNNNCSHSIKDLDIEKLNSTALNEAYRLQHNIISLNQLKKLPVMYGIGKRPLSMLLGWGELTFTRYFDGDIPTSSYANQLIEIFNSPLKYIELLEKNKKLISTKAYEKSKLCADKLLSNQSKISNIFDYILYNCGDITPLCVHKVLYYIQGFHLAFFDTDILSEECAISNYGPIYTSIYEQYKDYTYNINTHSLSRKEYKLSLSEKLICDSVIKNFGCYSGNTLTKFINNEILWINSMVNLEKNLSIEKINEYFKEVVLKYGMISALDIHIYAKKMFELI